MTATSDPLLTEHHRELVAGVRAVCERVLSEEFLANLDGRGGFPHEIMDALTDGGWTALATTEDAATGVPVACDVAAVAEELARHSLVVGQAYVSLWVLGADAIVRLGTREQRASWLPAIAGRGAKVAFAITESGAGSDAAAMTTRASLDGDTFVVDGHKAFVTGAAVADAIVTAVRTSCGESKRDGITLLVIDPRSPGVTLRKRSKAGLRSLDVCEVVFDGTRVPASSVLGTVDRGWEALLSTFAHERLYLAALSVGALRDVVERCTEHALVRTSFGKPIGSHQLIADKVIEMRVDVDSGRGLVKNAAALRDEQRPGADIAASIAKLHATRSYVSACREAVQVFGGYGFINEYAVSRHYRDCKYLEITGGTSEMQKILIGRDMGFQL